MYHAKFLIYKMRHRDFWRGNKVLGFSLEPLLFLEYSQFRAQLSPHILSMKSVGERCGRDLQTSRGRNRVSNRCYCAQDWNSQLPTLNVPATWCHASQTWWTLIPLEPKFRHVVQHIVPPWVLSNKILVSPLLCHSPVWVSPQDMLGTCVPLFCYWPHWGSVLLPLI